MELYIHPDLSKGDDGASGDKAGKLKGGKYVARVQTGFDKDGSPAYR